MQKFSYKTVGTCSTQINFEIENGLIKEIVFYNGCDGNLQGLCKLVKGRPAKEVADLLKGIKCGYKATSCPDQLARALEKAMAASKEEAAI